MDTMYSISNLHLERHSALHVIIITIITYIYHALINALT